MSDDAVTVSARGTIGYVAIRHAPFFPIVRLIVIVPNENLITLKFLYYILANTDIKSIGTTGGTIPQLTVPVLQDIFIPTPPLAVQQELVAKAESYEAEIAYHKNIMKLASAKKEEIIEKYL